MKVIVLSVLLASQAPGGDWRAAPLDDDDEITEDVDDPRPDSPVVRPRESRELPVLTWQRERELESAFRQSMVRLYLDLLGDPNEYQNRYTTAIPNEVGDWRWQRTGVQDRLWTMRAEVDKQMKRRSGVSEATLRRMIALKQDFRPEHLRLLMHKMPRIEDAVVNVRRIQPLGGDNYRMDYSVEMRLGTFSRTTNFQAVDVVYDGRSLRVPMRTLLDVSLRNERDIFGNSAPAAVSTPSSARSRSDAGADPGGRSFLELLLAPQLILLDLFN